MKSLRKYRHFIGMLFRRGERWRLVVAVASSFFLAIFDALSVLAVGPLVIAMGSDWNSGVAGIVASYLGVNDQMTLIYILLGTVIVSFIVKDLLSFAYTYWTLTFSARVRANAQIAMTSYLLRRPYEEQGELGLARITRLTSTAATQAYSGFVSGVLAFCSQSLSVIFLVAAIVMSAPGPVMVLLAVMFAFSMFYVRKVRPINERISEQVLIANEQVYMGYVNAFSALKDVSIRQSSPFFIRSIGGSIRKVAFVERDAGVLNALPKSAMEILFMVGLAIGFGVSMLFGSTESLLAVLAVIIAGAFRILPTAAGMMTSVSVIRQSLIGTEEFVAEMEKWNGEEVFDYQAEVARAYAVEPLEFRTSLDIDDVRFTYSSTGLEVLKGVSLKIVPGTKVAFVGSSGAGKSTLLDIVMGLLLPKSGAVKVDGVSIADRMVEWQANIALVPQEVYVTDLSIAENVAFDKDPEDIDEAMVWKALEAAEIADYVREHTGGIWSSFGERGKKLSGGQRQRLGIARALYRQPKVLVLDEATSALDNETEAKIMETISGLRGDLTIIVVAHRLSTVRDSDNIAYLEGGRLGAQGTFLELQEKSEAFRRLVALGSLETIG